MRVCVHKLIFNNQHLIRGLAPVVSGRIGLGCTPATRASSARSAPYWQPDWKSRKAVGIGSHWRSSAYLVAVTANYNAFKLVPGKPIRRTKCASPMKSLHLFSQPIRMLPRNAEMVLALASAILSTINCWFTSLERAMNNHNFAANSSPRTIRLRPPRGDQTGKKQHVRKLHTRHSPTSPWQNKLTTAHIRTHAYIYTYTYTCTRTPPHRFHVSTPQPPVSRALDVLVRKFTTVVAWN